VVVAGGGDRDQPRLIRKVAVSAKKPRKVAALSRLEGGLVEGGVHQRDPAIAGGEIDGEGHVTHA
jgi:hypothetical protein